MRWIVGWSLRARFLTVAIGAALLVFGGTRLGSMSVDVLPEFAPPLVEIQTEALGLSSAEVESLITLNLEELLSGVSWLQTIRSQSVPGLSSILLIFKSGTDLMRARQLVQERLALAYTLPNVAKPPVMLQPLSATSRAMMVGLSSNELSLVQMSVLARWTIKPRLMSVPGVANVAIWGQRERQLQVQVDPQRLQALGVSQEQIIRTAGDALWVSPLSFLTASKPGTGGWIDTPNQRLEIRHVLPISSPDDLARIPVDGARLLLGDVAEVVEGHPPLIGDALVADGPGLLLVVEKFPGANTLEVTRGVDAVLDALRPGLPGLVIDATLFRPATYIEMAVAHLTTVWGVGAVLVVLALGAFLYQWRALLVSCVAISVSLMTALIVLDVRGTPVNAMVVAGLMAALGVVVDDAIIDVGNMLRCLGAAHRQGGYRSTAAVILDASLEMRKAIAYAALILVLAVLPVVFMEGLSGALLKPVALSYVLAVLTSMATALTVAPALGLILASTTPIRCRESPVVRWLQRGFDVGGARCIPRPCAALWGVGVLALAGLAGLPWLRQESLFPAFEERDVLIDWVGAPGTSHPEMSRIVARAGRELRALPGVRGVSAHVGRAVTGDQVVGINAGKLWVSIDRQADYVATVARIQETVDGYPGSAHSVQTYLKQRIGEVLTGAGEAIVVRIYGPKRELLRQKAEEVRHVLSQVDGVVDLQVEGQVEEPEVQVEVDLSAAERHGLKPGDVRRAAATVFAGLAVGTLFEEQKVFDVVVWGAPAARHSLTSIHDLLIDTPAGGHVRLADVASVRIMPIPTVIKHEAISPRVDVVANARGRDLGAVAREIRGRLRDVTFPLEYHAELLGESVERQAVRRRMLGYMVAAAIGIFLLLQASFGSWRAAALVFVTLPVGLAGGMLALLAAGGMVSIGSLLGGVAVLSIAVRGSIVLIHRYQQLERQGDEPGTPALVLRGTRDRLAPIVMTAVVTGLACLPMVLFGGRAGLEILHPMAVVVLGGLVTSTVLNLFIVPALYLRFGSNPERPLLGRSPSAAQ